MLKQTCPVNFQGFSQDESFHLEVWPASFSSSQDVGLMLVVPSSFIVYNCVPAGY
jgi:hypothetical protein